jgi:hypothetical protein
MKHLKKYNESNNPVVPELPTAKELFKEYSYNVALAEGHYDYMVGEEEFIEALHKFARHHVEAALKSASENGVMEAEPEFGNSVFRKEFDTSNCRPYIITIDKKSILNAYPLENIK